MMSSKRFLYSLLFVLASWQYSFAQEVATQIAVGHANHLDTYLSPEKYRGTEIRFISEVLKNKVMFQHEGDISFTSNRANNADEISGHYNFTFAIRPLK